MDGTGLEGNWQNASVTEKTNWNMTNEDMEDVKKALETSGTFATDIFKTKESSREQCNDAVQRMKNGELHGAIAEKRWF